MEGLSTDQPQVAPDATATSGEQEKLPSQGEGSETQLPEEYRPYSQFPWDDIPEESRGEFLAKLKQFHGDMSRNQQELGDLRKEVAGAKQKAQWFDELTGQKWFMDAYMHQQQPPAQQAPEASFEKLGEYGIDPQASKLLGQSVQAEVQRSIAPVLQQLQLLQQSIVSQSTQSALNNLKEKAKAQGWPDPTQHIGKMSEIIERQGVRDVETAYKMALFDDILKSTETKARTSLKDELQRKAAATVAPYSGPAETPGEEQFVGADAVLRAFQQAKAEVTRRR